MTCWFSADRGNPCKPNLCGFLSGNPLLPSRKPLVHPSFPPIGRFSDWWILVECPIYPERARGSPPPSHQFRATASASESLRGEAVEVAPGVRARGEDEDQRGHGLTDRGATRGVAAMCVSLETCSFFIPLVVWRVVWFPIPPLTRITPMQSTNYGLPEKGWLKKTKPRTVVCRIPPHVRFKH